MGGDIDGGMDGDWKIEEILQEQEIWKSLNTDVLQNPAARISLWRPLN